MMSFDPELEADVSSWHHAHTQTHTQQQQAVIMCLSFVLFLFFSFCKQDVETVYRRAAATFPLLDSPTDTRPTCTASGESL